MATNLMRAVWDEPRAPQPPVRVWRDWVLVAALVGASVLESVARPDVPWRPLGLLMIVVLAVALLWRRTHPLASIALGFGTTVVVDVVATIGQADGTVGLYSMAFLLVLPYALLRWGSGREVVLGSVIAVGTAAMGVVRDDSTIVEAIIGFIILTFPAVLGASVRFMTESRVREIDQVRLREREQLARELHDTVAHHVSAMVIRAQAGRVVEATNPGAAVEALAIIEAEGSRTLTEMRTLVGALRDRDDPDLAPQAGIADLERLAQSPGQVPPVAVSLTGDLDGVGPAVSAALYRIAQESVTNARRHARNAGRIDVSVAGDTHDVHLTVTDDGDPVAPGRIGDGYGVIGMSERATLLGGSLRAGPGPEGGWVVAATLPRVGPAA